MPEPQPWRNPRPVPPVPEIQARWRMPRGPVWLRAWWPAFLWAGLIFCMSTDAFSAEHTGWVLQPILRWLVPSLTEAQFSTIHYFIRKSAHFTEYFVFCLLLYRGVRGDRKVGALAAFGALWMWFRWRRSVQEAEIAASDAPSA